jgi:hypothetical protein
MERAYVTDNEDKEIKHFSMPLNDMAKLGCLYFLREIAIHVTQSVWFFFVFRYVLHVEIDFWPFITVVFFGKWITDSIVTAIDDSVRKDTRRVVMTRSKNLVTYDVTEKEDD